MGFLRHSMRKKFEAKKPAALKADIRMISGCEDDQTSADVSNVSEFRLPDPAGRSGGACTSTLLQVLYRDQQDTGRDLTFVQVLDQMRDVLAQKGYTQIPQLTASLPIDVNAPFELVPRDATGTRRALLIGINYVGQEGQLSGCHNDVRNMVEYLKDCHGFDPSNIAVLLDDEGCPPPTAANMVRAYRDLVAAAEPGDALVCHYSGHGGKVRDDTGDEADGFDETLVPLDYREAGMIRDDDLHDLLVRPLPADVHLVCIMDCCHSGTVLDLPYLYKADGNFGAMEIDEGFDFDRLFGKFGGSAGGENFWDGEDEGEEEEEKAGEEAAADGPYDEEYEE